MSNPKSELAPDGDAKSSKEFSLRYVHLLFKEGGAEAVPGRDLAPR